MEWYEIVPLFFILGCVAASFAYATVWEVRRIRETIRREKVQREFYSEARTYFYCQNNR